MEHEPVQTSAHVEETVEQLSRMYDQHQQATSPVQRLANRITAALGRPAALVGVVLLILTWVTGNYVARLTGSTVLDAIPFPDLEFVATVTALLVALLILTTQRHGDELADKRARLTLQIAALSEKKIVKVIELLEEQRHDNPLLPERADDVAQEMAKPADAGSDLAETEAMRRA